MREIRYSFRTKQWQFNQGVSSRNPNGTDDWVQITLPAVCDDLARMGTFSAQRGQFNGLIGKNFRYTHGSHTYDVEVVREPYPWSTAAGGASSAAPPVAAPAAAPAARSVPTWGRGSLGFQVLFEGDFLHIPKATAQKWFDALDGSEPDFQLSGVSNHLTGPSNDALAQLAGLWSCFSQGFNYAEHSTVLWVKPLWFKTWCAIYLARDFTHVRLVGHGASPTTMTSGMPNDPIGPAICYSSANNRCDTGHYVALADGVPADYTQTRQRQLGQPNRFPDGTFVLEVLMEKSNNAHIHSYGMWQEYSIGTCGRADYHGNCMTGAAVNDARNVYDTTIVLPLGVAHAL